MAAIELKCIVCDDIVTKECVCCSNNHAVCRNCLPKYISSRASEPQHLVIERGGLIQCPLQGHGCDYTYCDRDLMNNLSDDDWGVYRRAIEQCAEWRRERDLLRDTTGAQGRKKKADDAILRQTEQATANLLSTAKNCPTCSMGICLYQHHGCHHITCTGCSTQFCYVCVLPYVRAASGRWHRTCSCYGYCRDGLDCGCSPCPDCRIDGPHCEHCDDREKCEAALRTSVAAARAIEKEAAKQAKLLEEVKKALATPKSIFTSKKILRINALKALMASEDELVACGLTGDMLLDAELLPDRLLTQDLPTLAMTADAAKVRRANVAEAERVRRANEAEAERVRRANEAEADRLRRARELEAERVRRENEAEAERVRRAKEVEDERERTLKGIEKEISRLLPKKDIIGSKAWVALNAARSQAF